MKDNDGIKISAEAADEVNRIRKENKVPASYGLRIVAKISDCCGFSYFLNFEEKPNEKDKVIESENISLFIDDQSLGYLKGSNLHFVDSPEGSGFVFNNPNEIDSFGCNGRCCGR